MGPHLHTEGPMLQACSRICKRWPCVWRAHPGPTSLWTHFKFLMVAPVWLLTVAGQLLSVLSVLQHVLCEPPVQAQPLHPDQFAHRGGF